MAILGRRISKNSDWSVKLVSYTDSTSEEEDLQVDVNFDDEPIDPAIN